MLASIDHSRTLFIVSLYMACMLIFSAIENVFWVIIIIKNVAKLHRLHSHLGEGRSDPSGLQVFSSLISCFICIDLSSCVMFYFSLSCLCVSSRPFLIALLVSPVPLKSSLH